MIEFKNICKTFNQNVVLDDINLTINKKEVVSILGASGAGKSTLVNCVNGLVSPDSGNLLVDGLSVNKASDLHEIRKRCSMVFQGFNLYPHLTILENITLAPRTVLKFRKEKADKEAMGLLERMGLASHAQDRPSTLSGGEKQRVGICRALAMSPEYLLLDEVTSSLDPELTAEIVEVLSGLAEQGRTMLLVTHKVGLAKRVSTRIVFLENGRILADESTDEFFSAEFGEKNRRIGDFLARSEGL